MTKKDLTEASVTNCREIFSLLQWARRGEGESVVLFRLGLLSTVVLGEVGILKVQVVTLPVRSLSLPAWGLAEMLQDEALHISPKIRTSSSKEDMATAIC